MSRLSLMDERGLVVGFFLKLLLFLVVLGIIAADGASIFFANLRTDDVAATASTACAATLKRTRNPNEAIAAALEAAELKAKDVVVTEITPLPQTGQCTVSARQTATTLVVSKVGFLKKYGEAKATETADAPTF